MVAPVPEPERWLDEHGDYLFRYAFLRLRDRSISEEIVQETFLAALQNVKQFSGQSTIRTWLTGILKHKIIDYYRKMNRERPLEDADSIASESEEAFHPDGLLHGHWHKNHAPQDWGSDPSRMMERKEFWGILQKCLDGLPPKMAQAFVLREVENLTTQEVCSILNISENNLWVLLHRARAQLRKALEEYYLGKNKEV